MMQMKKVRRFDEDSDEEQQLQGQALREAEEENRQELKEEAMERFITLMGSKWEPRRWSSLLLSKEGFRKDTQGQAGPKRWVEGEAY